MLFAKDGLKPTNANPMDVITNARPELKGRIQPGGAQGSNSDFCVVYDDAGKLAEVFKFPCGGFIARRVSHEIEVLKHLKGSGALVPEVTFDGGDYVVLGMKAVAGEPMTPDKVKALPAAKMEQLARSLGAELAKVEKAFSPRPAKFDKDYDGENVDREPYPSTLKQAFQSLERHSLSGDDKVFAERLLKAYEDKYKWVTEDRRVLSHNDLGFFSGSNVFYDPVACKVSAVIDWEIAGFRKPEEGFRELWKKFPPNFMRFVLDEYSKQRGEEVPVADVAAALLNQFIVKGTYNVRTAVREMREGFPELEVYARPAPEMPEMKTGQGMLNQAAALFDKLLHR